MDADDEAEKFAVIWHTLVAMIVASITTLIVATVVNVLVVFLNTILSDESAGLISLSAAITSTVAGVYAARALCDKLFDHYSKKAVFLLYAVFGLLSVGVEIYIGHVDWKHALFFISDIVLVGTAFIFFWQNQDLD